MSHQKLLIIQSHLALCGTKRCFVWFCSFGGHTEAAASHKKAQRFGVVNLGSLFISFLPSRHVKTPSFLVPFFCFRLLFMQSSLQSKTSGFCFLESAPFAETSVQRSDLSLGALTGHADLPPLAGNRRAIMEAASMCGNSCGIIAFAAEAASVQHPNRARWRRGVGGRGHGRPTMMQHQLLLASQHPRLQKQRHINSPIELIWT
jgi:hypothetical protein